MRTKDEPLVRLELSDSGVPPPPDPIVVATNRIILFRPDGTPLIRKIGF